MHAAYFPALFLVICFAVHLWRGNDLPRTTVLGHDVTAGIATHPRDCRCLPYDRTIHEGVDAAQEWANRGAA